MAKDTTKKLIAEQRKFEKDLFFDEIDCAGPFMQFSELERYVLTAPASIKKSKEFAWLKGFYDGRMVHECLGGIA